MLYVQGLGDGAFLRLWGFICSSGFSFGIYGVSVSPVCQALNGVDSGEMQCFVWLESNLSMLF